MDVFIPHSDEDPTVKAKNLLSPDGEETTPSDFALIRNTRTSTLQLIVHDLHIDELLKVVSKQPEGKWDLYGSGHVKIHHQGIDIDWNSLQPENNEEAAWLLKVIGDDIRRALKNLGIDQAAHSAAKKEELVLV